jgi:hypothetical protein
MVNIILCFLFLGIPHYLGLNIYFYLALNFQYITSEFRTVTVFLITDLQTVFHREFVRMFMIYFRITFQMPVSNGKLIIVIKP